jgi:type VI secretion system secreted protein Hcp
MAYEFYVSIQGAAQGKFKGESPRAAHSEKVAGLGFELEIKSPRDVATGQVSAKRVHGAVTFVKEWGASTPQLFQALVTNEKLSTVLMEFLRTNADGNEYVYHRITLRDAAVVGIRQYTGENAATSSGAQKKSYDVHELEAVSLTYRQIELENLDGKTMATDSVGGGK